MASWPIRIVGDKTRGQALVEFAFSFAILALMFFGLMMAAIILFAYLTTDAAASEGAHYAVNYGTSPLNDNSHITSQVCSTSPLLGGSQTGCQNILTNPDSNHDDANYLAVQCPPASPPSDLIVWIEPNDPADRVLGTWVTVTVCYHVPIPSFSLPTLTGSPLYIFGPIWVESASTMNISQ